jgi:gamma-glutamyl phosphate reductase
VSSSCHPACPIDQLPPIVLQDVAEAEGQVSAALLQRLILKPQKIQQLADGIRAIAAQEEPIRRVLQRMEVADGGWRIMCAELV